MRIACVHVPQFALQSLGRIDPSLRSAAVAVVGAGQDPVTGGRPSLALHSPIVLACSRAAWALGVRLGMTASAARYVSPELRVVTADGALERETVRAIADTLLGAAAVVDAGGRVGASAAHLAMYCEVPSKVRGATFGARLLDLLDTIGIAARIGIADDRFTAWVAAAHGADGSARDDRGVISVPRGGSAAFLAPRPLSLLAITPEVQHMLEALGVRTLGEFAALPAPSVARPLEADYQALARGDSGSALRPYAPEAAIREELVVGASGSLFGGAIAAATLAERVALRLAGRGRGATRIELTVCADQGERLVPLVIEDCVSSQERLLELLAPEVGEAPGTVLRLRVAVLGEAIEGAAEIAAGIVAEAQAEARAEAQAEAPAEARPAARREAQVEARAVAGAAIHHTTGARVAATTGARVAASTWTVPAAITSLADAALVSPGAAGRADVPNDPATDAMIDALSVALGSAGVRMRPSRGLGRSRGGAGIGGGGGVGAVGDDERSLPWQLSAPPTLRAERRDAHRRTRRASKRRRPVAEAQSQLFGQLDA
jgi:impB/mucB/samB family protein